MDIIQFQSAELCCQIECVVSDGHSWFRGKDVATALGYTNTKQAIQTNVEAEDKQELKQLGGLQHRPLDSHTLTTNQLASIFINEAGLYSLILQSTKPEAKQFKHWVTHEVLPTIRQTGTYNIKQNTPVHQQIQLLNEYDLHVKLIDFIRKYLIDPIIAPGLGELQTTTRARSEAYLKGYKGGQPDILLLNSHQTYNGLAIELKTPKGTGKLSENQSKYLKQLEQSRYKVIVSNDYDHIIVQLVNYFNGIRYQCSSCHGKCSFKSQENLSKHLRTFHRLGPNGAYPDRINVESV